MFLLSACLSFVLIFLYSESSEAQPVADGSSIGATHLVGKRTDTFNFYVQYDQEPSVDYKYTIQFKRSDSSTWSEYGSYKVFQDGGVDLGGLDRVMLNLIRVRSDGIKITTIPERGRIHKDGEYDFRVVGSKLSDEYNYEFETTPYLRIKFVSREENFDVDLGEPLLTSGLEPGFDFGVECPVAAAYIDCIDAYVDDQRCEWKGFYYDDYMQGWRGTNALFRCNSVEPGSHDLVCKARAQTPDRCIPDERRISVFLQDPSPGADLFVSDVSYNLVSDSIRIQISNAGDESVNTKDVVVLINAVSSDGRKGTYQSVPDQYRGPTIDPGENFERVIYTPQIGDIGGKTVFNIKIDPKNLVQESDEQNNDKEITFELPVLKPSCKVMSVKGDPKDKIDFVYLPYLYDSDKKFADNAKTSMESILSVEPFKSNADKLNFYYIDPNGFDVGDRSDSNDGKKQLLATNCPGYDEIIVLMNEEGRSFAKRGGHMMHVYAGGSYEHDMGLVSIHELGHSLGGLHDEYVEYDVDSKTGLYKNPVLLEKDELEYYEKNSVNCDSVGCSKWCSGEISSSYLDIEAKCSAATTEEECKGIFENNGNLNYQNCLWLRYDSTSAESSYVCSPDPKNNKGDFGLSCQEGAGCFLGCKATGGANLWRSSQNSVMANHVLTSTFNSISESHISSILSNYK